MREDFILFSESNSRFLVEVPITKQQEFEKALGGVRFSRIGRTVPRPLLEVRDSRGDVIVDAAASEMRERWKSVLR
jgi:phosphoribosylformylglycinamidine synthase